LNLILFDTVLPSISSSEIGLFVYVFIFGIENIIGSLDMAVFLHTEITRRRSHHGLKARDRAALLPGEGQNCPSLAFFPLRALSCCRAPRQQGDGDPYIAGIRIYAWIMNTRNYSRVNAIRFTDKLKAPVNLDHNRN